MSVADIGEPAAEKSVAARDDAERADDGDDADLSVPDPTEPLLFHMLRGWPRGEQLARHCVAEGLAGRLTAPAVAIILNQVTDAAPWRLGAGVAP